MAISKHFVIEVKPEITASKQASMADGDVLFDWTSFDIPKGAAKLTNVTMMMRGNDASPQTARDINLYFARTDSGVVPGSLGTMSATVNGVGYYNHLLGKVHIEASGDYAAGLDFMSVASTGHGAANNQGNLSMVLQGEPETGTNVGYDKLYIGGVAGGALDFSTGVLLTDGFSASAAVIELTCDGVDARKAFTIGDVLHADDDAAAGTVTSVGSATSISVKDNAALLNNDELFNLSPLTFKLSFER
jgi:hypothetical protein